MLKLLHKFISAKSDGTDATEVKPSNWNDEHDFESDQTGVVLGRDTTGPGSIQELPFGIGPDGSVTLSGGGAFAPPRGTTAARPASPTPGAIRFNTTTNLLEVYGLNGQPSWTPFPSITSGFIGTFAGPLANIPAGWYYCDGSAVSRTTDAALFAAIGTSWGVGDGSTTFNIPSLIDRVLVGAGDVYGVGTYRGAFNNTIGVPLPQHNHSINAAGQGGQGTGIQAPGNLGLGGTGGGNVMQYLGFNVQGTDLNGTPSATMTIPTEQYGAGMFHVIKR